MTVSPGPAWSSSLGWSTSATSAETGSVPGRQYSCSNSGAAACRTRSREGLRIIGYDDLNRVAADTIEQRIDTGVPPRVPLGTGYGYDRDDNITAKTTTQPEGSTANTYTYDGVGRLKTWTTAGTTVEYGFDDAGNRTKVGPATAIFNERNQLTDDGANTYTYTPRGTLSRVKPKVAGPTRADAARALTFDAFERVAVDGSTTHGYDSLDRVASRNGAGGFQYDGLTNNLVSDGGRVVSRDAAGQPFADRATGAATGQMLYADRHGDITGRYLSADVDDTRSYDPFGNVTAATGETPAVGYQGGWTDPESGAVNMAARWYQPGTGTFNSRDTWTLDPTADGAANRYAYAGGDPLGNTDPGGHFYCPPKPKTCPQKPQTQKRSWVKPSFRIASRIVGRFVPGVNVAMTAWDIVEYLGEAAPAGAGCRGPRGLTPDAGHPLCDPKNWCGWSFTEYCGSNNDYDDLVDLKRQRGGRPTGPDPTQGGDVGGGGPRRVPPPPPPPPWIPPLFKRVAPPPPSATVKPRPPVVRVDRPDTRVIDPGLTMAIDNTKVTEASSDADYSQVAVQGQLEGACATGGLRRQDGSRSAQVWQCADPGADPGNVGAPGSSVGDPSSGRHGPPSRTFFSVQSEHDARRLHAGGETWPTGLERANLGPGFYAWDNEANAEAYLKLRSQREWAADAKLRIVRATISESDYQSLRMLDLRTWSDEDVDAWMELYSLYGEGRPHGYDHVIRGAGLGDEFYFSPDVFHLFGLE